MRKRERVAVIGEGAWGTAMAQVLADVGHEIFLWCHDPENASCIGQYRINKRYMPGVRLSKGIVPVADFRSALHGVAYVFEAIPVQYLRNVVQSAAPYALKDQVWIVLSKGIEQETLCLPAQIIDQELAPSAIAVLSGPSYAAEVVARELTAVNVAAYDPCIVADILQLVTTDYFIAQPHDSVVGIQLVGAIKNVVALAVGIAQGAGLGENAQAIVMTCAWNYVRNVLSRLGADDTVIHSLAGIGDIMLTAMGTKSRNRHVGVLFGQGKTLADILQQTGYTPEAVNTLQSLQQLGSRLNIHNQFIDSLHGYVFDGVGDIHQMVREFAQITNN